MLNDQFHASQVLVGGDQLLGVTVGHEEVFRSNLDGSDLVVLHGFGPGLDNGILANNDLTLVGSTLYGSTLEGGEFGASELYPDVFGTGIVYALPIDTAPIPEPGSVLVWLGLAAACTLMQFVRRGWDSGHTAR